MLQKITASMFLAVSYWILFPFLGVPQMGTFGALLYINIFHIYLFISFYSKIRYLRYVWAGSFSLLAVLISILSVFKGNQSVVLYLHILILICSLMSLYYFSLKHGVISGIFEIMMIPFTLVGGFISGFWKLLFDQDETWKKLLYQVLLIVCFFVPIFGLTLDLGNQHFWVTMILFLLSVGLNNIDIHFKNNFGILREIFVDAYWEALLMSIITLGAFIMMIGFNFSSKFMLFTKADLDAHAFSDFNHYFAHGTQFLALFALISLVSVGINMFILEQKLKPHKLPRLINSLLLAVVLFLCFDIYRRAYLVFIYGRITTFWLLSIIGISVLIFVVFSLLYRLLLQFYYGWYVVEASFVLVVSLLLSFTNIENGLVFAQEFASPSGEIDYVTVSEYSCDASEFWVDSYYHAVKVIQKKIENPDDVSRTELLEASRILHNIRHSFANLSLEYGNQQEIIQLTTNNRIIESTQNESFLMQTAQMNVAQWNAYRELRNAVTAQELVRYLEIADSLIAAE